MFYVVNPSIQPYQGLLAKHLRTLFDGILLETKAKKNTVEKIIEQRDIHENTRKTSTFKYDSGGYMEFDIWIPKYRICFEFQVIFILSNFFLIHPPLSF